MTVKPGSPITEAETTTSPAPSPPPTRTERVAVVATLLVLAYPRLQAWRRDYRTLGDAAVISERAHDILGPGGPLLGMPSSLGDWSSVADPFHPGPAVFWLMAPTSRLLGGGPGALVGSYLLVAVLAWWIIRTSTRRLGHRAAPGAAAACILTAGCWPSTNPLMGVLPALALCFAVWSVLDRDRTAWPWLAATASFAVQADLAFLPTSAALVGVAIAGEVHRRRRGDRVAWTTRERYATLAVLALFWALPLADAIANQGGNVRELLKASVAGIPTRGADAGALALVVMLLPPLLCSPILVRSWRADRRGRRALAGAALAGAAGSAVGQAMVPIGQSPSLTSLPVIVSVIFILFATATLVLDERLAGRAVRSTRIRWLSWASVALATLLVAPTIQGDSYREELYPAVDPLTAAVVSLPGDDYRLQPLNSPTGTRLALGLAEAANRRGTNLRVDASLAAYLGPAHRTSGREQHVLYLSLGSEEPPVRGARVVGRWVDPRFDAAERRRTDREVAAAVRSAPVRWAGSPSQYLVGSAVAAGGVPVTRIDEDDLTELGRRLVTGAEDPRRLSDAVLAELVAQDLLELPREAGRLRAQLDQGRDITFATVWIADDR